MHSDDHLQLSLPFLSSRPRRKRILARGGAASTAVQSTSSMPAARVQEIKGLDTHITTGNHERIATGRRSNKRRGGSNFGIAT